MKGKSTPITDLEEARIKIQQILREYNCVIFSADEWSSVIIKDKDTKQSANLNGN